MNLTIRIAQVSDLDVILKLFSDTISSVCKDDYNQRELEVWKSSANNVEHWQNLILQQYFLVGEMNDEIVGFASLDHGNYVDVLYVHRDFQKQGIAQNLYSELETEAIRLQSNTLTADVSKTAKSFFERNGFTVVAEQIQIRQNVEIINFKMKKSLNQYSI
ncbi:GNAT family N-acetyltransferase [Empedobacter sedimenti]|uniref:GNAT family N-acetyltransferase n=1 Tax=Empedobacter sedimenti TaxID=3042610 RepID=UPI0024A69C1A|nr:GNAT family N-acetyltransferase [Empedobacter sedimenti]